MKVLVSDSAQSQDQRRITSENQVSSGMTGDYWYLSPSKEATRPIACTTAAWLSVQNNVCTVYIRRRCCRELDSELTRMLDLLVCRKTMGSMSFGRSIFHLWPVAT